MTWHAIHPPAPNLLHMRHSSRFPLHRLILPILSLAALAADASPLNFKADLLKNPDGGTLKAGDKPVGFKIAPVIIEKDGTAS